MRQVEVDKDQLIRALEKNMVTHVADFEIAWEAYRKAAISNVEKILASAKSAPKGKAIQLYVNLQAPENHESDYTRALEMCDWELNDKVTLSEAEFRQFVQDEWGWKDQFESANMMYTGSASPSARR